MIQLGMINQFRRNVEHRANIAQILVRTAFAEYSNLRTITYSGGTSTIALIFKACEKRSADVCVGHSHFTLKGLKKVRTDWSLITLAYNQTRVEPGQPFRN